MIAAVLQAALVVAVISFLLADWVVPGQRSECARGQKSQDSTNQYPRLSRRFVDQG